MTKHEPMGPYLAVFNSHINNAASRAMTLMNTVMPEDAEKVRKVIAKQGGIMGIFDVKPTDALRYYVAFITAYVNEDVIG